MNKGVEILLARMDSHPQEFVDTGQEARYGRRLYGRWTPAITEVLADDSIFTDPERSAIGSKIIDIRREVFTAVVLRELLAATEGEGGEA